MSKRKAHKQRAPRVNSLPVESQAAIGDSYSNPLARLGVGTNNQIQAGRYVPERISLDYQQLVYMYRSSFVVQNIVDVVIEDMLKQFPALNCDVTPEQISDFERVVSRTNTHEKTIEAGKWGRLFGGAIAVMCIDGHDDLMQPLDLDDVSLGAYRGLIVIDRWSGVNPSSELISDFSNPAEYGLPVYYECTTETGASFRVHHSRVLRFIGRSLPLFERQIQSYWGMSEVEVVYEELRKRDYTSWSIANLVGRAQTLVMKEPMLAQGISGVNLTNQQLVDYITRIQAISESINTQGLLVLGADSDFFSNQFSFGGLPDIQVNQMLDTCAAARMPMSKVYGRSATGLGQTGDGDLQNYENRIDQDRNRDVRPQLMKLFPVICMSTWGYVPDDLDFTFPSIRTMTESDKADLAKTHSDAVLSVLNSSEPLISPQTALRELKQLSSVTGMWSNITDELVAAASDEVRKPVDELSLPGLMGEEEHGNEALPPGAQARKQLPERTA